MSRCASPRCVIASGCLDWLERRLAHLGSLPVRRRRRRPLLSVSSPVLPPQNDPLHVDRDRRIPAPTAIAKNVTEAIVFQVKNLPVPIPCAPRFTPACLRTRDSGHREPCAAVSSRKRRTPDSRARSLTCRRLLASSRQAAIFIIVMAVLVVPQLFSSRDVRARASSHQTPSHAFCSPLPEGNTPQCLFVSPIARPPWPTHSSPARIRLRSPPT